VRKRLVQLENKQGTDETIRKKIKPNIQYDKYFIFFFLISIHPSRAVKALQFRDADYLVTRRSFLVAQPLLMNC
jgi:hypothetical protein